MRRGLGDWDWEVWEWNWEWYSERSCWGASQRVEIISSVLFAGG